MIRILIEAIVHYAAGVGLLLYLYSWSLYSAYDFPKRTTLLSYLLAAAIVTAFGFGLFVAVESGLKRFPRAVRLGAGTLASVVSLAVISFCIGTGEWDVNVARLHGIFFAEWHFLIFFVEACLPMCLMTLGMEFFRLRTARVLLDGL